MSRTKRHRVALSLCFTMSNDEKVDNERVCPRSVAHGDRSRRIRPADFYWLGPRMKAAAASPGCFGVEWPSCTAGRNDCYLESSVNTTKLPPLYCDAIMIRDAYHHLTRPDDFVKSLAASRKLRGRLTVIDFPPRANSEIPAGVPANRRGHGVLPDLVQQEVGAALTHVRTVPAWSPDSQPASLFLCCSESP